MVSMTLSFLALALISTTARSNKYVRVKRASTVCFDKIGCFDNGGSFSDFFRRPINSLPADPKTMNIKFGLYTRSNSNAKEELKMDGANGLKLSTFDSTKEVKFIVHGFTDTGESKWFMDMVSELLKYGDYNAIVVDWRDGALLPYQTAVANTRVVGAWIAEFIKFLGTAAGIKPENCHVIGHSLGAHVAGYCGERLQSLGRISGLDAASPFFEGMDKEVVLDHTDANFVDIIHTDGHPPLTLSLGYNLPLGHMDFYPNNGMRQPDCTAIDWVSKLMSGNLEEAITNVACNHMRALALYTESINTNCPMVMFSCSSWADFKNHHCGNCGAAGNACVPMGFHSVNFYQAGGPTKKYYGETKGSSPFCYNYYKLKMVTEKVSGATDVKGDIYLSLDGATNDVTDFKLYDGATIKHPNTYYPLLASRDNLGAISSGKVLWKDSCWFLCGTKKLYVKDIEISIIQATSLSVTYSSSSKICNPSSTPKKKDQVATLEASAC